MFLGSRSPTRLISLYFKNKNFVVTFETWVLDPHLKPLLGFQESVFATPKFFQCSATDLQNRFRANGDSSAFPGTTFSYTFKSLSNSFYTSTKLV